MLPNKALQLTVRPPRGSPRSPAGRPPGWLLDSAGGRRLVAVGSRAAGS